MTDYEWERNECKEQKERYEEFRKNPRKFQTPKEQERLYKEKLKRVGVLACYAKSSSVKESWVSSFICTDWYGPVPKAFVYWYVWNRTV
jgi:hypothetical protein